MITKTNIEEKYKADFNYLMACFIGVAYNYYEHVASGSFKKYKEAARKINKLKYQERKISLHISQNKCTGCEDCFERCPHQVIGMVYKEDKAYATVEYLDKCVGCGKCEHICKEDAVELNISSVY